MSVNSKRAIGFTSARVRNVLLGVLLPVALVLLYFAGLGGATARSQTLPVLLVNNDQMVEQANSDGTTTQVVAGRLLVSWLTAPNNAGGYEWELVNAQTAQERLDSGRAYAAVQIPEDFSASVASLGSAEPHAAKITITVSEGSDFATGAVTEHIFAGITAQFGQQITNMVAVGLTDGLNESANGLQKAADGAQTLADGAGKLSSGFEQYRDGVKQLTDGAGQLQSGSQQLMDGITGYESGVAQYVDGVTRLANGLTQLDAASPQLQQAAGSLGEVANQLSASAGSITRATTALQRIQSQFEALDAFDANGFAEYCNLLDGTNPEKGAECHAAVTQLSGALGGAKNEFAQVLPQVSGFIQQLGQLSSAGDQLGQLASGIDQYTSGVTQSASGAEQLRAAGSELVSGGSQLVSGGEQLNDAVGQLQDGGEQLAAAGAPISDGIQQLRQGASTMSESLQQGAEQAKSAIGNPQQFADALAKPVVSEVERMHDISFTTELATLLLPLGVWLAALITALRRGLMTDEMLDSSASSLGILLNATRRLAGPLLTVAGVIALAQHTLFGVPWRGIGFTLLFGALSVLVTVAIHLLLVALAKRRTAAVISLVLLAAQFVFVRGFFPLELRAGWVSALSTVTPWQQLAGGMQAGYAGAAAGGIVGPALILVVLTAAFAGAAAVVIRWRRHARVRTGLVLSRAVG